MTRLNGSRAVAAGAAVLVTATIALLWPTAAGAQFSPGKLSRVHAELEGSTRCLDCHSSGEGVSPERCLSCHAVLRRQIDAGQGLHAGNDYQRCETCHMDHNGEAFELVFWGDRGMESFEHGTTGYRLEGSHREVACRDCHRTSNIASPQPLRASGKDLDRTFLGLGTSCLSCHDDRHHGEFTTGQCLDCHSNDAWKPASGFDHQRSGFPLTGLHREVACTGCHTNGDRATAQARSDADRDPLQFKNIPYERCTDCHSDPHDRRLGSRCESCHSTAGWLGTRTRSGFNHEQTRYPLRGRHTTLACEACHSAGRAASRRLYSACTDCHRDPHAKQFVRRGDRGACDSCHTVTGFEPARFDLSAHQETAFPLAGAHLAIACDQCHLPVSPRTLAADHLISPSAARGGPAEVTRFRFASAACRDCHDDAHQEEPEPISGAGCDTCHAVSSWLEVTVEHDETSFPLTGQHREAACDDCHRQDATEDGVPSLRLTGLGTGCTDCHLDEHVGQLAAEDGSPRCMSCHQTTSWQQIRFDHDLDSRFRLAGGHRAVECAACHGKETLGERHVTRYRPTPTTCEECHR